MYLCARKLLRYSIAPLFLLIFYVQPVRAALTAVPNSIDFGKQPLDGIPQSTIITLNNNTPRTFSIVSISDSTPEFSLSTPDLPVTLPPGGSLTVNVTFMPDAAANFSGSLGFTTSHGWTVNVPISGTGQGSEDNGNGSNSSLGRLSFNPVLNFGTPDASGSAVQLFTITNSGSVPVTISNVSLTGSALALSGISNGLVLSPGQSDAMLGWYPSQNRGSSSGTITIASDAANSPAVISWTAGIAPDESAAISTGSAAAATSEAASSVNTTASSATAIFVPHSVDLTWSPSSSDGIFGYKIYRSSVSGGPYNPITTGPVATTDYVDTTATSSQTFYYVVTALAISGQESGFSGEVAVAIP